MRAAAQEEYVPPMSVAAFYEGAGDVENAVTGLRRGFEVGDPDIPYIGVNMKNPAIQAHPDFEALLLEMKLDHRANTCLRHGSGEAARP